MKKLTVVYTNMRPFTLRGDSINIQRKENELVITTINNLKADERLASRVSVQEVAKIKATITIPISELIGYRIKADKSSSLTCFKSARQHDLLVALKVIKVKKPVSVPPSPVSGLVALTEMAA